MAEGKNSLKDDFNMIFRLFIVCGIAAGSLALVDQVTSAPIAEHQAQKKREAMVKVLPDASTYKEIETDKCWEGLSENQSKGHVFMTQIQGYSGPIKIAFGLNKENKLSGVSILEQTETPGLGAKIIKDKFLMQYNGKTSDELILKKDSPKNGQIDAITAATISSRAVTKCVKSTIDSFLGHTKEEPK